MQLDSWGGGWTQLVYLRAKDVSAMQHDRVRFELQDLENQQLFLRCERLSVTAVL